MVGSESSDAAVICARNLTKEYQPGTRPALSGVDVEVTAGSLLAVMGPSGSGKSTLLHLLGALDTPTTGSVEIAGRSLDRLDDDALSETRRDFIGFVFQSFNLVPVLSAAQNVALPGVIARRPAGEIDDRVGQLLELVGLGALADRLPSQLSGGEQQRVAVARALLLRPPVLLADEPTGNLDSATGDTVLELLRRTADELGTAVVMVTHDARAAAHGDEALLLHDGTIAGRLDLDRGATADERAEQLLEFVAADGARAVTSKQAR
jgi:putative ABC transport system ATP-binding protein